MAFVEITGYRTEWNASTHQGKIDVSYHDRSFVPLGAPSPFIPLLTPPSIATVIIDDIGEMALIIDMLRNESPIFFDSDLPDQAKIFRTGSWESPGEG